MNKYLLVYWGHTTKEAWVVRSPNTFGPHPKKACHCIGPNPEQEHGLWQR